jgi:hypothetical protein
MHRFSPLATAGFIVRPAAGAALAVLRGNLAATRYYVASALGRLEGYVAARPRC